MSFVFFIFCISILFFFMFFHPFFLCLILILSSLMLMFFLTMFCENWFNLILILVYLGGLLVIFVFITSLVPNIKMEFFFFESFFVFFLSSVGFSLMLEENFQKMIFFQTKSNFFEFFLMKTWYFIILFLSFLFLILVSSIDFVWKKNLPLRSI